MKSEKKKARCRCSLANFRHSAIQRIAILRNVYKLSQFGYSHLLEDKAKYNK